MKRFFIHSILFLFCKLGTLSVPAQHSEKIYLSGRGSDDAVNWQFYCTAGMNSGKWTTIPVPSCWELQGFGKYDYGFARDSVRGKEEGLYKYEFEVPLAWRDKTVYIHFEGVMTDAEVKVNGRSAAEKHQGAFYAFQYDISSQLKWGRKNMLEVRVAKHSANASVNEAERKADFWIFGGIFRPVWLEAVPKNHVSSVAIHAKADGHFEAKLQTIGKAKNLRMQIVDAAGNPVGSPVDAGMDGSGEVQVHHRATQPRTWSSEDPYLYKAIFQLMDGERIDHQVEKKFGFRTVEVKQRDGVYINGQKIKFKGVNRHSFRPETGRTLSRQNSIEDILLMKEMNMNAVRMSHYPPDDHFLDACDSLGLYVMDELAGWHGYYDTRTGTRLLKEMIRHDQHHPSIVMWSNGNEGGHNLELDSLFAFYDLQQRPVVHPWQLHGGIETQHYREYHYGIGNYEQGREIVMPTEFLHGQFDGGHGAGLEDYWEKMWHDPLSAGGFLWDFADQAVVRRDLKDSLDTDKHRGADGILGPHFEKEGSYYAIQEIWSPIRFEKREITDAFDGLFTIENRFHFTNINQCRFQWTMKKLWTGAGQVVDGPLSSPDIKPGGKGSLKISLPTDWRTYDVLYIRATGPDRKEIFTWSFPVLKAPVHAEGTVIKKGEGRPVINERDSLYEIIVKDLVFHINRNSGLLHSVGNQKGNIPLTMGPQVQEGVTNFRSIRHRFEGDSLVIESAYDKKESFNTLTWTIYPSGWIKLTVNYFPAAYFTNYAGISFYFPENEIRSVTYLGDGPYRVWKNRMKGNRFGLWTKQYNNTETGEWPWVYPEFKGYHSNVYRARFDAGIHSFTVVSETEGMFLRLFTPAWKTDAWHNYEPHFPAGDISFLQGISSIGTKTQRNETTGPMGFRNIFYDYEKDPGRALTMVLYFDFTGN